MFGGENMPLPFPKHPGWSEFQGKHACPGGTCLYTTGTPVSPNASTSEGKALVREGFSGSGFSEGRG